MTDRSPEDVGATVLAAQAAIHTLPAGWWLGDALAEFGQIMSRWAQHPKGRNWNLISDLEEFIHKIESRIVRIQGIDHGK